MPIRIDNITDEAHQRHTIIFEESEVIISLRFLPVVESWVLNVQYKTVTANGYKLSLGTLHLRSRNLPFDFVVLDNSGTGLDPYRLDDFSENRCQLYMLNSDDMEAIRNAPVPI